MERPARVAPALTPPSSRRRSSGAVRASPPAVRRQRLITALCCLGLTAALLAQDPGRIVPDTKLDLGIDPARFLAAATRLWQPQIAFGELQNQAYGYLFPMGPFFALGHGAGIPAWVTERLWQSALLVAAFVGCRALARRLGIGTPATRLFAALAYALSPFVLSHLGPISSEAQPECLAPLVLAPLVGPEAPGRPRRAACASGVALLLVGGVNASATLAVLVPPLLWFLLAGRPAAPSPGDTVARRGIAPTTSGATQAGEGRPPASQRRLFAWWLVAVVLATLWWAVPLVLLGRYGAPFTDWIESAATTTSSTSLLATMQGTADWVGHILTGDGPGWPAQWLLVSRAPLVVATLTLVVAGVGGLARRDLPARPFLVTSFVVGVALVAFGHSGPASAGSATGSGLGGAERSALDGALVAFRNVVKFNVVLRIPLALGLAHTCTVLAARLRASQGPARRLAARGALALTLVALLGSAWPLWSGQEEAAGSFTSIPSWWDAAARWLAAHDADGGRVLLLPASQHPDYLWGFPTDEPFQVLATVPWAVRDAVPLGGAGEARLLDAVDAVVGSGQGSPGLAAYLARAGVQWLVVRNDLDRGRENGAIPPPLVVQGALEGSPGIRRVAAFGPSFGRGSDGSTVLEGGTPLALPAVEIFEVAGPVHQVVSYPLAGTWRVSGGPESLLELANLGLLPAGRATVMAADPTAAGTEPAGERAVVTDGYRNQEVDFGRAANNVSATLLPGQPWSQPRAVHDYLIGDTSRAAKGLGEGHQTTAILYGVAGVEASSSASDADAVRDFDTEYSAAAAFEQIPGDAWVNGSEHAVGQWLQERFVGDPVLRRVTIATPAVRGTGSQVSEVRVGTAAGSTVLALPAGTSPHTFGLPPGRTGWLRVTILAVRGGGGGGAAALSVAIPGVPPAEESLQVPNDVAAGAASPLFVVAAEPGGDDGCVALRDPAADVCDPTLVDGTEDSPGIDRTFDLARPARYGIEVEAVARSGPLLASALPTAGGVRVSASSQRAPDPSDDPQTLFEDDPQSGWVASTTDPGPSLTIVLPHRSLVHAVELQRSATLRASTPLSVGLRSVGGAPAGAGRASEVAAVHSGLAVLARPLAGRVFVLTFPRVDWRADITDQGVGRLPVGLSGLALVAAGLSTKAPALDSPVRLGCGAGPRVWLDGRSWPTAVQGTLGAVLAKQALRVIPCGMGAGNVLELAAGTHHLRAMQNGAVTPDAVVLTPRAPPPAAVLARPRSLEVLDWGDESRAVRIGPGPASFVVVRENANAGWVAALDGRRLAAATVDGWQQAFVVPAGAGGVVQLSYQPNGPFRGGLLAGAAAAASLLVLALVPVGRRRRRRRRAYGAAGRAPDAVPMAGEVELGACRREVAPPGRDQLGAAIAVAAVLLTALELGAVPLAAVLVVDALGLLVGWSSQRTPPAGSTASRFLLAARRQGPGLTALVALGLAAVLAAQRPQSASTAPASGGMLVQMLCLVALAALSFGLLGAPSPGEGDVEADR